MSQIASVVLLLLPFTAAGVGCAGSPSGGAAPPPGAVATEARSPDLPTAGRQEPFARRSLALPPTGFLRGISYGPFRTGQAPGGPLPSPEEVREDLHLLAPQWDAIRVYSSLPPTDTILAILAADRLPLQVVIGAWISPDDPVANAAEVAAAIRLARAYPEIVLAVTVGNESQVDWSAHRTAPEVVRDAIRQVRAAIPQPVSTADDYNFWNKPHSHLLADEVDFLVLHAYAMWNGKTLEEAVPWTAATVDAIRAEHPDLPIVLGETGWATALNPEGDEARHIRAPAGEAEQARFYQAFSAWTAEARQSSFYFEAFDEPWKGSADPREVEKHWGLYTVERTPKLALQGGGTP